MTIPPIIETRSGQFVNVLFPDPATIKLEDIAYALARVPRYNGHTSQPYSVAQHSVLASLYTQGCPLTALMHDAHEAYIGDIATPVAVAIDSAANALHHVVRSLQGSIGDALGIQVYGHADASVKVVDQLMLAYEAYHLMPSRGLVWPWKNVALPEGMTQHELIVWDADEAEERFLARFEELMKC